ncbi:MAG: IS1182 family transposase, partial [Vicinamibacterales bacterium]
MGWGAGMLGKRGPQRGLFEADTAYGEFVGRDSFYGWLASQRGELFRDEEFAGLYALTNGRPSVPPSVLAVALVLQTYDGVSDAEAKQRADYDLRWKVALGVELDARPFAKSTLQEFRAQLILHEEQAAIFRASLELAKRRGRFRAKGGEQRKLTVALDTTNILGRGAVKDTYNLLGDGIIHLARELATQAGQSVAAWSAAQGYGRYVGPTSLKGTAEIDWSDPEQRRRFLGEIVADADRLLEQARVARQALAAGSPAEVALLEASGLLRRLLIQDVERRADGPAIKDGVAKDRVPSVHDPEMRHGRKSASKRFDGHKAAVAVDADAQVITAVTVLPGNAQDHERALDLVAESEANTGCAVAETLADGAYGAGETRQAFADAGRRLVAKVPAEQNGGRFTKGDFTLDLEAGTCTCPGGQQTRDLWPRPEGGGLFRFAADVCAACPLRAHCLKGQGGRSVRVHPQEGLLQAARAEQAGPAGRDLRTRRQAVEHRIARLVQLGIRQARFLGRTMTLFQLLLAAAVANLSLLASRATNDSDGMLVTGACCALLTALLATRSRPDSPNGLPRIH